MGSVPSVHVAPYDAGDPWPDGCVVGNLATQWMGPQTVRVLVNVTCFGVLIPAGYVSDGASSPWWAQITAPRFGPILPAALVHDCRYDPPDGVRTLTRKEADDELYDNCRKCGWSAYRAWKVWAAVRVGGAGPWNRNTRIVRDAA